MSNDHNADAAGGKGPVVRFVPLQAHCFAFGGFDLQMIEVLEAVRAQNVNATRFDLWSREDGFDLIHFWGLDRSHGANIHWAKRAKKGVVITALLPYLTPRSLVYSIAARFTGRTRLWQDILRGVDRLVVVNKLQAKAARYLFGIAHDRVNVIPHVVAPAFFSERTASRPSQGYVLCTGNICRRKNQLSLVRACQRATLPLLLIGDVLTGEEAYGDEVFGAMHGNSRMRYLPAMAHGSKELVAAYRGASVVALVSENETQPISLLEGAVAGCPILVADRRYSHQEFYAGAVLVNPSSIESIARGLTRAVVIGEGYVTEPSALLACSKEQVGQAYAKTYTSVWRRQTRSAHISQ